MKPARKPASLWNWRRIISAPGFGARVFRSPGVTLELIAGEDRFNIEARRGRAADLAAAIAQRVRDRACRRRANGRGRRLQLHWRRPFALACDFARAGPRRKAGRAAAAATRECATIVDVSHGFASFRLSGPKAVDALAKLVRIDLDAASFPPGAVASTELHGMSVQLRLTTDGEAYECAVSRSFAASLYHALTHAADPYGIWVDLAI